MNSRVTYLYAPGDFGCQISAKKNWVLLMFVPLLLSAKAEATYSAISLIIHSSSMFEFVFRFFWLLLFASIMVFLIAMWLWNAFGREVIMIGSGLLTIKHDVFGFGKAVAFPLKEISNVRISEFHNIIVLLSNFIFWDMNAGMIAFDYKGETFRFGIRLGEAESYKLMKKMKRYFEE